MFKQEGCEWKRFSLVMCEDLGWSSLMLCYWWVSAEMRCLFWEWFAWESLAAEPPPAFSCLIFVSASASFGEMGEMSLTSYLLQSRREGI